MFTKLSLHKFAMGFLAILILILAACTPTAPMPQTGDEPAQPQDVFSGLDKDDVVVQLTYEPGFVLPEYRFSFGRTPYFTLLADGRVIYVDENQDSKVMLVDLSQEEAALLLKQVRDLGFERLESHTDMCGKLADGSEPCIADASTSVLRVRMDDGSLREIRNYANFSNDPAAYDAIFNLLSEYDHAGAEVYVPHAATLFVRLGVQTEMSSPADWPLDAEYVKRAETRPDQATAVALSADEAAQWVKAVGLNNSTIVFQLDGQPVMGMFVPWLPGENFSGEISAEFPAE